MTSPEQHTHIALVLFDMDGVVFQGDNFWLDLHHAYGTAQEGLSLASQHLNDEYELLAELVAGGLWKGRSAQPYYDLVQQRRYTNGVREVFDYLHRRNIRTAIISTGPYDLARRAQRELGVEEIRANRLGLSDGLLSGEVELQVIENQKALVGSDVAKALGLSLSQAAFVGDSDGDVGLAEVVSLPIAYDSKSDRLSRIARHVIPAGKLQDLIAFLEGVLA